MLGIYYLKSNPTTYVMRYKNGHLVDQGVGLSLLYFGPSSTIVRISQASQDIPFVFEQPTSDFQNVTIQGNLTYRIVAPERLAQQLDFSVDSKGRYLSDDPHHLQERLVRLIQSQTHSFTRGRILSQMLNSANELSLYLSKEPSVLSAASSLGLEFESFVILSIRAEPEMSTAMQAEARELLLQKADEAIHARRRTAMELERQIREKELDTEQFVQLRKRELREAELDAEVALERGRAELVIQQVENEAKIAEARVHTLRATLDALRDVDWRTLAASSEGLDSKRLIAMAFAELAQNAAKIGRLDISPDLLRQLMDDPKPSDE